MLDKLQYPFDSAPALGQLHPVAPGVFWLRMALPFTLDHVNLWILDDHDGIAIVDNGVGNTATRETLQHILTTLRKPVTKIVVTHFHPDHMGNTQWLVQKTGAPVFISTGEFLLAHALHSQSHGYNVENMVEHFHQHGLDQVLCDKLTARGNVYARGVPELPLCYQPVIDGDGLPINSHRWEAISGYGHSPEHMAYYCESHKLLISGDMLLPRITTNVRVSAVSPEEDSVGRFLNSIQRFAHLPDEVLVLPSHGLPFYGAALRVAQLIAHHESRNELLLEELGTPKTAAQLLSALFARELDAHQVMFAMGEAIAHLNHLLYRGSIRRTTGNDGQIRFQTYFQSPLTNT